MLGLSPKEKAAGLTVPYDLQDDLLDIVMAYLASGTVRNRMLSMLQVDD